MHQRRLSRQWVANSAAVLLSMGLLATGCAREPHPVAAKSATKDVEQAARPESAALKREMAEQLAAQPEKLDVSHLPNAYRIHPKVISGGLPEGDEAFAELKALGVKTVISVDGAKPDVAMAKKYEMRYVHLPHGYDGVPANRAQELAKAVRDLEGPVYIHCHHGKHRSPAAATVACVSAGMISPAIAKTILHTAGTSENYRGLYQSAESARELDSKLLDELKADFPETAPIPPMAEAMIGIEHAHDHLKALAATDWQPLPMQPALDPAHEALLVREHFTELQRTDAARREPEGFQKLLAEGETAAKSLEDALLAWQKSESAEAAASAKEGLETLTKNCAACHRTYRDVPLTEKSRK
jgi:protein tyrosine phosphatase (PTP) superfamily phosphohydrolase (DUF442 family)